MAQLVKNCLQCRRPGFDPWVGKILLPAGEGTGYPFQYSGLDNSMESQSWTRLSDFHFHFIYSSAFNFSLSCTGEGNGNPLQCSCLENPRDGGAWWAAIYGVTQGRTRLKQLSSSSSSSNAFNLSMTKFKPTYNHLEAEILKNSIIQPQS